MTHTCVCFLTHRFDDVIRARLEKLVGDCEGSLDVYVVAEEETPVPAEHAQRSHAFDFSRLRQRARTVIGNSIAPGNCHLRMMSFFDAHPSYDWYWFVEYDVSYDGDWEVFFADFDDDPADLLGTHVRTAGQDPDWYWSATFDSGGDGIDPPRRHIAFLPIARLSRVALRSVSRAVERGWVGHFEMLVPTAVVHAGLTIAEIGGTSAWAPPRRRQRHYLSAGESWKSPALSTVRFRPVFFGILPKLRHTLYHPDKGERASFADVRLAQQLFRQSLIGHPGKTLRYWATVALRSWAQPRGRDH